MSEVPSAYTGPLQLCVLKCKTGAGPHYDIVARTSVDDFAKAIRGGIKGGASVLRTYNNANQDFLARLVCCVGALNTSRTTIDDLTIDDILKNAYSAPGASPAR
jgi:hypothetical protein